MAYAVDYTSAGASAAVVAVLERLRQPVIPLVLAEAVHEDVTDTLKISQEEYVPIATGFLKDSAFVDDPYMQDGTDPIIIFGYRAPYAAAVHEIPPPPDLSVGGRSARHPHGQWKYLEVPVLERSTGALERIGDRVTRGMQQSLGGLI